jgi:hypothetical protein
MQMRRGLTQAGILYTELDEPVGASSSVSPIRYEEGSRKLTVLMSVVALSREPGPAQSFHANHACPFLYGSDAVPRILDGPLALLNGVFSSEASRHMVPWSFEFLIAIFQRFEALCVSSALDSHQNSLFE